MKKYIYNGDSNLTFSFEGNDYLVSGAGPHELPSDAQIVQRHIARGSLIDVTDNASPEEKVKTNKNI
jgi:hypothetical protein